MTVFGELQNLQRISGFFENIMKGKDNLYAKQNGRAKTLKMEMECHGKWNRQDTQIGRKACHAKWKAKDAGNGKEGELPGVLEYAVKWRNQVINEGN